jgi:hypothetical protein
MRKRNKNKKKKIKFTAVVFLTISFLFCLQLGFCFSEKLKGLVAGQDSDSITVSVDVISSISIDSPADVSLAPDIEETGSAIGSATWNVKTNSINGWKLQVNAGAAPALRSGGNSFDDYGETVPGTPEIWSVDNADSEFGFGASGAYIENDFNANKFLGFDGANKIQVAHRNAPSDGAGDDTTVDFKAEVGAGHNQPLGTYSATITATATTL